MSLQHIHKIKNKFNIKTRRRKYKLKITNKKNVRSVSYLKTISPYPRYFGLRVDHACRLKFNTLIGAEKSLMATKEKVFITYKAYPNFFVTKKSSKARMGKGKGKIIGRILRIMKGEIILNVFLSNPLKSKK